MLPDGGTMVVVPGLTGSLVSLRAAGGAVTWSVSVANDPGNAVSVSPAAGTLTTAVPAATLRVTTSQFVPCGPGTSARCPTVTVSPGGATFAVWTGWVLPAPPGHRPQPVSQPRRPRRQLACQPTAGRGHPAPRPAPPYNSPSIMSYA